MEQTCVEVRHTKKDADGRYYIESVNGLLESDKFGHVYGKSIDRFAELEDSAVGILSKADIVKEVLDEIRKKSSYTVTVQDGVAIDSTKTYIVSAETLNNLEIKYKGE